MKIAYIYTALTSVGGADRVITDKANYFADKLGYEVYIITDSQLGKEAIFPLSKKIKHIDLGINFDKQYHHKIFIRFIYYIKLMNEYKRKLRNKLLQIRPDIVITTCGRDLDFITRFNIKSKIVGESHISKKFARNFHLMEQRGFLYKGVAKYWRRKQEKAIKKLDAFVLLTQHDANSWKDIKDGYIIPNSLTFYPESTSNCDNKKVISVGRLDEQKGFDMLISVWEIVHKNHSDWEINIYGEGMLYDELTKKIFQKGLEKCFKIHKPVKNIVDKYLESSIYVMSSRFEGFGMVLVESMACGVPCISFDCPYGPSDIIKNNEDGLLVKNGDINAMAERICYLIENQNTRKEMGIKARKNIKRYSPDIIMNQWDLLFKNLLK